MSNTVIVLRLPEEVCDDCAKEIIEEVLKEEYNLTLGEVDLSVVTVKARSLTPYGASSRDKAIKILEAIAENPEVPAHTRINAAMGILNYDN